MQLLTLKRQQFDSSFFAPIPQRAAVEMGWGGGAKRWLTFQTKSDVTRDDSKRRFLAQHSVATLFRIVPTLF